MEDLSRLTLRELLTRARERFGAAAASLKTREELVAALEAGAVASAPTAVVPAPGPAVAPVVAPALSHAAPPATMPAAPRPAPVASAAPLRAHFVAPPPTVVTRDFFRRRN